MGVSTDAILAFGFDLGEEEELPEQLLELLQKHEHDVDDALADDHGFELPEYEVGCDYKEFAAKQAAAHAKLKICLIDHCSGECTMYFLAARGSERAASRGNPTALEPADFDTGRFGQDVLDAMRAFCDRHGIEWQEPKWHIFSMWR